MQHGPVRRSENYMSGIIGGSYAYLGRETTATPPTARGQVYLSVELGEACQLSCRHCIYHRQVSRPPNPLVEARLTEAFQDGLEPYSLTFSGKEPTLFPRSLLTLATLARKSTRISVLITNGHLLRGALLAELRPLVDYFDVSIDGTETAHDWMRGEGTFGRSLAAVDEVLAGSYGRVGVTATAVHGMVASGRQQVEDVVELAGFLGQRYGGNERLSLSVSLYYGPPGDPLLLGEKDLFVLIRGMLSSAIPCRILWTAQYARLWGTIAREFGWSDATPRYDDPTGVPVLQIGELSILLFNLTPCSQDLFRISNDGLAFLGCGHLTLGDDAAQYAIANLEEASIQEALRRIATASTWIQERLANLPRSCASCPDLSFCRGGDGISGLLHTQNPVDPYCQRASAVS